MTGVVVRFREMLRAPGPRAVASLVALAVLVLAFPPAVGWNSYFLAVPVVVLGWSFARSLFNRRPSVESEASPPTFAISGSQQARLAADATLRGAAVVLVWVATVLPYPIHAAVELFAAPPPIAQREQSYPQDGNCLVTRETLPDLIPTYLGARRETRSYVRMAERSPSALAPCTYMAVASETDPASIRYRLSVLQFEENGRPVGGGCSASRLIDCTDSQMAPLLKGLRQTDGNVVVVYVHGWRHDSRDRSGDLGRLATLANYSASFVEQRNEAKHPAKPLSVTAVYIGWRGSLLANDDGGLWSTIKASLTFPSRKNASERASVAVIRTLDTIQEALRDSDTTHGRRDANRSRMLVVGHSAGGNLLMEGLQGRMSARLGEHVRTATHSPIYPPMRAPLGDLVVLLNPASEARKWVDVQRSFFTAADEQTGASPPFHSDEARELVHRLFPNSQPPSVLAITAGSFELTPHEIAERLAAAPERQARQAEDRVTSTIFQLSQMVFFGQWFSGEGRSAIGHYNSGDVFDSSARRVAHYLGMPPASRLGLTHSLEANGYAGLATHFNRASRSARCEWKDGSWLWYMRRVASGISVVRFDRESPVLQQSPDVPALAGWDGNSLAKKIRTFGRVRTERTADGAGSPFIRMQYRHRPDRGGRPSAVPPAFPYWNIKATDSAIANHGDFVSYPLWCSLHQLILDDPARPPIPRVAR